MALTDRVIVGDNDARVITPATAHVAIQQAIDDVEAVGGGRVLLLPGSADYVIGTGLTVNAAGIEIVGTRGAVLTPGPGVANMLLVQARDFALRGVTVKDHVGAVARRLVYFADAGGVGHDWNTIEGVTFDLNVPVAVGDYAAIRALGQSEANPSRGLDVLRCTFLMKGEIGPATMRCFHGIHASFCRIAGNRFVRADISQNGLCEHALLLEDCIHSIVESNSFQWLTSTAALIKVGAVAEEEGHHVTISGNRGENLTAPQIVLIEASAFDSIQGNAFGRLHNIQAAIKVAAGAVGSRGTLIVGNQVHAISSGTDQYAFQIDGAEGVNLASNQVYNVADGLTATRVTNSTLVRYDWATNQVHPNSGNHRLIKELEADEGTLETLWPDPVSSEV